jgi:hypothetical protein
MPNGPWRRSAERLLLTKTIQVHMVAARTATVTGIKGTEPIHAVLLPPELLINHAE